MEKGKKEKIFFQSAIGIVDSRNIESG